MIHELTLRNFKGIESATLGLERLTVIVGPNASGKTSVLQALDLMMALSHPDTAYGDLLEQRGGISALTKRGSPSGETSLRLSGRWDNAQGALKLELLSDDALRNTIPSPKISIEWAGIPVIFRPNVAREGGAKFLHARPDPLPAVLKKWAAYSFLRLEARKLAETSYTPDVEPQLASDGAGLASVLAQMALSRPDDFKALLTALRGVIPQVLRVRLSLAEVKRQENEAIRINDEFVTRTYVRTYSGHRLLFDLTNADGIPSQGASEGTLLVLGLLAVLFSAPRPKLVLLDDLDRGLHPKAQEHLVAQLRELLKQDPELQIVATSHSPYLIDHLDPKEVRLSNVLPDGTIHFAELTQHPDFARWKEVMRPGEFWSTVGEGWVGDVPEKKQG
ncbi:AAA family ATPase [Myxococcus sp. CA051A]|uniref:AAA family ATPase n=1 Tax=Myxococcus sp. CA051A TaxID=2741739 RepID=UPI00157AD12D|nr:ATP-binding protein [Myxococcus sp. CA051A]NTX64639.1 AAA family ATPase [Myxococcus sp. CA051A]